MGGGSGGGEDGGDEGGAGDWGWGDLSPLTKVTIWSPHVRLRVHGTLGNTPNKELLGGGLMGGVCIGLDSDRAGSRTL